jgi:hypothetical protein
LDVNGNIFVEGAYIYQNGSGGSGTVNSTGGPLIYADANNTVIKLGSTAGALLVQNYNGANINVFSVNGNSYFNGGNVGIGTASPGAKLEVQGGAIKATGGLIIETRTSDPSSPVAGQIWLRTDI